METPWMEEALRRFPLPDSGVASAENDMWRLQFCNGAQWGIAWVLERLSPNPTLLKALKDLHYDLLIYHDETGKLEQAVSEAVWDEVEAALQRGGVK